MLEKQTWINITIWVQLAQEAKEVFKSVCVCVLVVVAHLSMRAW